MRINFLLLAVSALFIFNSCATDTAKEEVLELKDVLPGDWHLVEAKRDNKVTTTLQGVYFSFDTLGLVKTNFVGAEINTDYKASNTGFSFTFQQNKMDYQAEILDPDTLNLKTKVRIFDFDLILARGKAEN